LIEEREAAGRKSEIGRGRRCPPSPQNCIDRGFRKETHGEGKAAVWWSEEKNLENLSREIAAAWHGTRRGALVACRQTTKRRPILNGIKGKKQEKH